MEICITPKCYNKEMQKKFRKREAYSDLKIFLDEVKTRGMAKIEECKKNRTLVHAGGKFFEWRDICDNVRAVMNIDSIRMVVLKMFLKPPKRKQQEEIRTAKKRFEGFDPNDCIKW